MPQIAADPRRHRDHHRHARGPRGEAARALRRRRGLLRHRHRLPRRERRQPDPAQRGRASEQLRVFAKYAPEFACLTRGIVNAGKLQAEAFRGFTLHIVLETLPNQPRAVRRRATRRASARTAGPNCLHLPNPPWNQANPVRHQPDFDDGVDEPTGKGTSRVAPNQYFRTGAPGSAEETDLLRSLLGPGPGRQRRPTYPTSASCWSARWPAERRCRCDEDPRQPHRLRPRQAARSSSSSPRWRPRVLVVTIGNISFAPEARLPGRVRRRHRRGQGRRHPDRRREGRHRQGHRDRRPHPGAGDLQRRERPRPSARRPTPRSATATWSASATSRSPTRSATPAS